MARGLAEVLGFGRYEPLFRIGIGGMAEVYAARIRGEAGFQKLVAVKRMLPHLTGDPKFVGMFLDEARLAANIQSPHVVSTLDLGRSEEGALYIVMELVIGVTIGQVLVYLSERGEYIDPLIGLELVAQAAQGLDDAHEARAPAGKLLELVHRDVSPQNILIGLDGRARMTDFGIAHALHLRRTQTQVGEMKGKFSYFSPEQAKGLAIDRRSDIFALGVVGWEVLTGRRLFRGKMFEALEAIQSRPIPPPHELRPSLPPSVSDVLLKALERDPDARYPTASAFAAELRRTINALGEAPDTRTIGSFVTEVGGDRLDQIQQHIASADGSTVTTTGTAVLDMDQRDRPLLSAVKSEGSRPGTSTGRSGGGERSSSSSGPVMPGSEHPTRVALARGREASNDREMVLGTAPTDAHEITKPPATAPRSVAEPATALLDSPAGGDDREESPTQIGAPLFDMPTVREGSRDSLRNLDGPTIEYEDPTAAAGASRLARGARGETPHVGFARRPPPPPAPTVFPWLRSKGIVPANVSDLTVVVGIILLVLSMSFGFGIVMALSAADRDAPQAVDHAVEPAGPSLPPLELPNLVNRDTHRDAPPPVRLDDSAGEASSDSAGPDGMIDSPDSEDDRDPGPSMGDTHATMSTSTMSPRIRTTPTRSTTATMSTSAMSTAAISTTSMRPTIPVW
jgi:serine/threonine-protein kinase